MKTLWRVEQVVLTGTIDSSRKDVIDQGAECTMESFRRPEDCYRDRGNIAAGAIFQKCVVELKRKFARSVVSCMK